MKNEKETDLKALAKGTKNIDAEMEHHPSIQALVKILARKAAEEQYDELLGVMRHQFGNDVDKE